jgi:glycosyltransferase involved in cell wall biosynthesis
MEALACGTPVVGFDIGGNKDMIEHQQNGYLAQPFDPTDLASGIAFCLDQAIALELQENARSKVVNTFEAQLVAMRYKALYEEVRDRAQEGRGTKANR